MLLAIIIVLAVVSTAWPVAPGARPDRHRRTSPRPCSATFVLPFEIVSVLLLAAVIGGVFLAKREHGGVD